MGFAVLIIGFILAMITVSVLVLTWVLSTLLPLVGVTQPVNWLHGLALFLLIGFFGSRVRSSK
jgi:hypothetical protein